MTVGLGDLAFFLIIAAVVGIVGVALGIVVFAPRITRMTDRQDEEPRDQPD